MVTFLSCPGDMDIGLHIYTDIYVCDKGEQEERVFFFCKAELRISLVHDDIGKGRVLL